MRRTGRVKIGLAQSKPPGQTSPDSQREEDERQLELPVDPPSKITEEKNR